MKTLFTNCKIYNGSGSDAFMGEVLVENDKIIEVSVKCQGESDNIVDLNGLSLSSGFIDCHSHNDWFACRTDSKKFFVPFVEQGITTFVCGNCGLSAMGYEKSSATRDVIGGGLFSVQNTEKDCGNVAEYFDFIDKNTNLNIATLVGHCTARASVAGDRAEITADEQQKMLEILEENLQQGACGISLGLMYVPGIYSNLEELKAVAKLCEKYDKVLTVHPRANSSVSMAYPELLGRSHLLRAMDELVEVTKGLKVKLQYSHAIFVGKNSFKCNDECLEIIENMRKNGVDAMFDIYAEDMGVSVITVILPGWYQSLSDKDKNKLSTKIKLAVLIYASKTLLGFGFNDIEIAYIGKGYEQYEGKTVAQIAKELKMSNLKAYLYLCDLSENKGRVNMGPYSTDEIISKFSKHKNALYMTDAWVEDYGVQNRAIYDCFPKFLKLSLEGSGDTMPNTIRKMTGATADRFGFKDRGYVKEGYYADFTIFDESKLIVGEVDVNKPFGIEKVYVNGKLVKDENGTTPAFENAGRAIKA